MAQAHSYEFYLNLYRERQTDVIELQRRLLQDHLNDLAEELELNPWGMARVEDYIHDPVTTFRTLRRCSFDMEKAIEMTKDNIIWRIDTEIDQLSIHDIEPRYIHSGLFHFHGKDKHLRPAAVLNLRYVERTEDNSLDELKRYILFMWEIGRRWTCDLTKQDSENPRIQISLIVDLEGSGMANMEFELVPFLLEMLRTRFPGTAGIIYILNYGWMYSGMWQVAKRMIPNAALSRIKFVSKEELKEYFDELEFIHQQGKEEDKYVWKAEKCPVLQRYGKPQRSLPTSLAPSRTGSLESIADVFFSAPGTPWQSRPSTPLMLPHGMERSLVPSWLSMTSGGSNESEMLQPYGVQRVNSLRSFKLSLPGQSDFTMSIEDAEDGSSSSGDSEATVLTARLPPYPPTPYDDRRLQYHRQLLESMKNSNGKEENEEKDLQEKEMTTIEIISPTNIVASPLTINNNRKRAGSISKRYLTSLDPSGSHKTRKRDMMKFLTRESIMMIVGINRLVKRQINLLASRAYGSDIVCGESGGAGARITHGFGG